MNPRIKKHDFILDKDLTGYRLLSTLPNDNILAINDSSSPHNYVVINPIKYTVSDATEEEIEYFKKISQNTEEKLIINDKLRQEVCEKDFRSGHTFQINIGCISISSFSPNKRRVLLLGSRNYEQYSFNIEDYSDYLAILDTSNNQCTNTRLLYNTSWFHRRDTRTPNYPKPVWLPDSSAVIFNKIIYTIQDKQVEEQRVSVNSCVVSLGKFATLSTNGKLELYTIIYQHEALNEILKNPQNLYLPALLMALSDYLLKDLIHMITNYVDEGFNDQFNRYANQLSSVINVSSRIPNPKDIAERANELQFELDEPTESEKKSDIKSEKETKKKAAQKEAAQYELSALQSLNTLVEKNTELKLDEAVKLTQTEFPKLITEKNKKEKTAIGSIFNKLTFFAATGVIPDTTTEGKNQGYRCVVM